MFSDIYILLSETKNKVQQFLKVHSLNAFNVLLRKYNFHSSKNSLIHRGKGEFPYMLFLIQNFSIYTFISNILINLIIL